MKERGGVMYTSQSHNQMITGLVMAVDVVLCCIIYVIVLLSQGDPGQMWILPGAKSSLAIIGVVYAFVVWRGGTILNRRNASRWQILYLVLKNVLTTAVICTVLLYVCHISVMSWRAGILMYALAFVVCAGFRLSMFVLVCYYRLRPGNYDEVVLLGEGDDITRLYREMANNPQWGYKVIGYFAGTRSSGMDDGGCRYLGGTAGILDFLKTHTGVSAVFCSTGADTEALVKPLMRYCVNNMVTFYSLPSLGGSINNRLYFTTIGNVPVLTIYDSPLTNPWRRLAKRTFDIVFSLLFLCTLFIPIAAIVAIITKVTMPGPVFFRQKRNGLNGRTFYCLKFRSMKVNDQADTLQATEDDPRITKWGKFMRHTNIDELPQFINVLIGDMSVVGPRPHMQRQTVMYSKLIEQYMMRHMVKPGITGWSQISGFRGETTDLSQMEGRVKHDIWYIENWSFGLDLFIIYRTIITTIKGDKNAY